MNMRRHRRLKSRTIERKPRPNNPFASTRRMCWKGARLRQGYIGRIEGFRFITSGGVVWTVP